VAAKLVEVLEDVGADANVATNAGAVDDDRLVSDVARCGLQMDDEGMVGGKAGVLLTWGHPFPSPAHCPARCPACCRPIHCCCCC